MKRDLRGKKIAVLVETEYLNHEIELYRDKFSEQSAEIHFLTFLRDNRVKKYIDDPNIESTSSEDIQLTSMEMDAAQLTPETYDIIIIAANYVSVYFRKNSLKLLQGVSGQLASPAAMRFFEAAMENKNILKGAISHSLCLLAQKLELLSGRKVTCHTEIANELYNSGALLIAGPNHVVIDDDLVTARSFEHYSQFLDTIIEASIQQTKKERQTMESIEKISKKGKRVHIVVSSFGFQGEELVAPLEEFDAAGVIYDFSTPYGHPPQVMFSSINPNHVDSIYGKTTATSEMTEKVLDLINSNTLDHYRKVSDVDVDDFDAILLVGGSGALLDMNNCKALHELLWEAYHRGKLIIAESTGIGTLAYTRKTDNKLQNKSLINGRLVTGDPIAYNNATQYEFSNYDSKYPLIGPPIPINYLNKEATYPDGEFVGDIENPPTVVVDYPFITSHSASSSRECGQRVIQFI